MANYEGKFRTNAFKVRDEAKFKEWVDTFLGDYEAHADTADDGTKWFIIFSEDGGFPNQRMMMRDEAIDYVTNNPELFPEEDYPNDEDAIGCAMDDPYEVPTPDGVEYDAEFDFCAELALWHLTDDCVVIAQEIGNERVRYLYGHVVVFDSLGNTKWMNLTDWAMTTAKESWPDKTCPKPEY